jgi:flagellar hook-associated protein 3 FlgL
MGLSRITPSIIVDRVLRDLRYQTGRLLDLERQLATGLRVNKPSDDPLAARRAIAARGEIARNNQYITNISNAQPFLVQSESSLSTAIDRMQRTNELVIQGLSDTNAQQQRDEIANEINQILESVLNQANTTTAGRYVFGGNRTLAAPFEATRNASNEITAVSYVGNNEKINVEVNDGVQVPVNLSGNETFLANEDVFQTLIDIRDNLRTSNTAALETNLQQVQTGIEQLLIARSEIGAVQSRLENTEFNLDIINIQLEQVISDNIDADFAEVIVELNAQTNAYQAALNAAGRVIQPSLLDFIR